jgi:hypothetical protein
MRVSLIETTQAVGEGSAPVTDRPPGSPVPLRRLYPSNPRSALTGSQ